ncbi:phage holin family protein [Paracoccaceae bacterium GXU_MW_L88]
MYRDRSIVDLIGDSLKQATGIFRNEIDLARVEVSENVNRAAAGVGMIAAAAVIALVALNVLVGALITALIEMGMEETWAVLLVGGGLGLLAFILLRVGMGRLKASSLAPTRTLHNVNRQAQNLKGQIDGR